jgi:hypothetical protein
MRTVFAPLAILFLVVSPVVTERGQDPGAPRSPEIIAPDTPDQGSPAP